MTYLPCYKKFFLVSLLFLTICYMLLSQNKEYFSKWEHIGLTSQSLKLGLVQMELLTEGSQTTTENLVSVDNVNEVIYSIRRGDSVMSLSKVKKSTSNIFFIESSCATERLTASFNQTGRFMLNPRQCCAVESTAANNPERPVFILHTCPLDKDFLFKAPVFSQNLLAHDNVYVLRYNMSEFFADTPVQQLAQSRRLEQTQFPVEHASDVLRITTLWKFGGTYLDLDIITLKSFEPLGTNFCARESKTMYLGSAVLNFEPEGYGHGLLTKALQHLNQHFKGSEWTANGPDLITGLITRECGNQVEKLLSRFYSIWKKGISCNTFTVYDHSYFYPILFWDHPSLFNTAEGPAVADNLKKTAYIVHTWNAKTKAMKVRVGSPQAYGLLADEFCRGVYRNCGDVF